MSFTVTSGWQIILCPIGCVFNERGCGGDLLINVVLTMLGYIPGVIHALCILPHAWKGPEARIITSVYQKLYYHLNTFIRYRLKRAPKTSTMCIDIVSRVK